MSVKRRTDTGRWRARWRGPDGKQRGQDFDRKEDAVTWESQQRADASRGVYLDPRKGQVTLSSYVYDEWLPAQTLRPGSQGLYESHLRNHIIPALGSRRLVQVTPTAVRGFIKRLGDSLAPSTVSTVHGILAMIFKSAVNDGYLAKSPCVKTAPRQPRRRRVQPLNREQVQSLSEAMPPRLAALVYAAAGLGLRQGECLGLTVDRVRFLQRQVSVHEQLQTLPSGELRMVPPKTRASDREVPLPAFVADKLSAHIAEFPPGRWNLIFTTPQGAPYGRSQFGRVWRAAVASAGLPKGTRLHDLRHTYVAMLIASGAHPKVIQSRLGHASISETMDTYGHLFPEAEEGTREAIDRAFSEPDVASEWPGESPLGR